MIKRFFKNLLFSQGGRNRIISGPASGMVVSYDPANRTQHLLGIYEREIYKYLERGVRRSDLLIDVGANDGYYVLAFLKSGKEVIACEPGPIKDELVENARINQFNVGKDFQLETRLVGSTVGPNFVSIADLANQKKNKFILVDIDGGELDLLHSCGSDFLHHTATWLIEVHSKELERNCIDYLVNHGYSVKMIKNAWWRMIIPEKRPLELNRWLFAEPKAL